MSYVIQAVLSNAQHPENGSNEVLFPLPQKDYANEIQRLGELGAGDAIKRDCMVGELDSGYEVLQCLKGQTVNVDELDYLAKRLDSFDGYEAEQFQASCYAFGLREIKDLINMTFCCQEATVIGDFSNLEEAGKQHYLTIHGGTAPVAELEAVDGKALAQQLIQSDEGKPTPYGLFFRNGMRMEERYHGVTFPPYSWASAQGEIEIKAQHGMTSYVFLPTTRLEMERFLQRGRIRDLSQCKLKLDLYFGALDTIDLSGDPESIWQWNDLCREVDALSPREQQRLCAAMEVTGAEDIYQIQTLLSCLNDFDLLPGVRDAESYGKYMIQKSGRYDYDESLDCYYNYEALGEFLLAHEIGQMTKQGYLKCEEGSAFLDFFTQEVELKEGLIIGKTLRDMIIQFPDASFHIMSPDGYLDFTPEQARRLLDGEPAFANPGASEHYRTVDSQSLLSQIIIDGKQDGCSFGLLTGLAPQMDSGSQAQAAHDQGFTMEMGGM